MTTAEIPVFVTYCGRGTMLAACLDSIWRQGFRDITVVDNTGLLPDARDGSTKVVRTDNSHRHLAPWKLGLVPRDRAYIVTEEDIEIDPGCPDDLAEWLSYVLTASGLPKIGLSIRTDDVPDVPRYRFSLAHERALNAKPPINREVDTHFAIHAPGVVTWPGICGGRLDFPYACRHLPWYNLEYTDEELAFYERAGDDWKRHHSAGELCSP